MSPILAGHLDQQMAPEGMAQHAKPYGHALVLWFGPYGTSGSQTGGNLRGTDHSEQAVDRGACCVPFPGRVDGEHALASQRNRKGPEKSAQCVRWNLLAGAARGVAIAAGNSQQHSATPRDDYAVTLTNKLAVRKQTLRERRYAALRAPTR